MKLPYVVKPAAQRDFDDGFDWYEKKDPGRGDDFAAAFHAALDFIRQKPQAHPTIYRDIRAQRLPGYPYRLMYRTRNAAISVIAVHHDRSNAKKWQRRA